MPVPKIKYPRVPVSARTHYRATRLAKKKGTSLNKLGNKIVLAGLKALESEEN